MSHGGKKGSLLVSLRQKMVDSSNSLVIHADYCTTNAMETCHNAGDARGPAAIAQEARRDRLSFVQLADGIVARDSLATKCGFNRHREVGSEIQRLDFVLESGNGDTGNITNLSMEDPSENNNYDSAVDGPDTSPFAGVEHMVVQRTADGLVHGLSHGSTSQQLTFSPSDTARERCSSERSWPLRDPKEAKLLRHFVDRISIFIGSSTLPCISPHRARYCDTLFNAIMALSARHLSSTADLAPLVSDQYYQKCLETLIPALNDHRVTMDDDLLAATVILRLHEEFSVPLAGSDLRGHSFGTKAFIQGPPPSATSTPSLRQAVYWSGLRQEIYNALSLQQAPDVDLSSLHSLFTALGPDAGDCAWANRAIAHCADVLLFSFGTHPRSVAVHAGLCEENGQWREARPASFDPYYSDSDVVEVGATFPDIRFSSPWHAIGNQYIELARILLLVYDPGLPTVGPLRRRFEKDVKYQIRKGVWTVCGVALANTSVPPSMVVGCMAIHICGDRFTDRQEQEKLIQVLARTDTLHGWPTHAFRGQLCESWAVQ
ncbi:hypothetical protein N7470_008016 [Penicillium chermesinum]|nr:hypothetical protein N7470_008016 [Penicillium chermesinum]